MAFLKENPRSLALFFILSGIGGILVGMSEVAALATIARQPEGLSTIGKIYQVLVYVSIGIALVLLVGGVLFRVIANAVPMLVPATLVAAIIVKLVVLGMVPQTMVQGGISIAICAYLFFQYRRISGELTGSPKA